MLVVLVGVIQLANDAAYGLAPVVFIQISKGLSGFHTPSKQEFHSCVLKNHVSTKHHLGFYRLVTVRSINNTCMVSVGRSIG